MQVGLNTFGSSFPSFNVVIAESNLNKELYERAFKAHSAVIKSFSSISVWSKNCKLIEGYPGPIRIQTNVREAPSKRRKTL